MVDFTLAHLVAGKTKLLFTFWINYTHKVSNVTIPEHSHPITITDAVTAGLHSSTWSLEQKLNTKTVYWCLTVWFKHPWFAIAFVQNCDFCEFFFSLSMNCAFLVPRVQWWMQDLPWCDSGHRSSVLILAWLSNDAAGFSPVAVRVLSAVPSCFLTARVAYEIPVETPLTHLDNLQ